MLDEALMQQRIDAAANWTEVYQIGCDIYDQAPGEGDALIMHAYERAMTLGLNVQSAQEEYLTATQRLARIYNRFRLYQKSLNMLLILEANQQNLPDWVPLYYAAAAIHTDTVRLWAESPEMLFRRVDGIDESDAASVDRRRYIYLEFMNRIRDELAAHSFPVDIDAILAKAEQLELADSEECWRLRVALGLADESQVPTATENDASDETETQEETSPEPENMAQRRVFRCDSADWTEDDLNRAGVGQNSLQDFIKEQIATEFHAQRAEQQRMVEQQRLLMEQMQTLSQSYLQEIASLHEEIGEIASRMDQSEQALGEFRAYESAAAERAELLELQLSEMREAGERIAAQAEQAAAEATKAAASASWSATESRRASQNAASITNDTSASTRRTFTEVYDVDTWLPRKQKILVIGASQVDAKHLLGKLKNMTFNITKDQIEFMLDYDAVTNYADRIKPYGGKYAGIIVGPTPHSAAGNDGYASFISRLTREPGYPPTVECKDRSGNLKISKDSIGEAMKKLAVKILSQM